jgi:hypothetical protein
VKKILAALAVVILAYVASPYAAVALVMRAVSQGDEDALASRIDFASLRASITEQLQARMARPGQADDSARMMLPTLVNSFVTPQGFATMLRASTDPPLAGAPVGAGSASPSPARANFGDLEVGWFFFTGPARFEVHSKRGNLVLEPRGAWWRVVDLELPPQERGPELQMPRIEPPISTEPPELETPDFGAPSAPAGS